MSGSQPRLRALASRLVDVLPGLTFHSALENLAILKDRRGGSLSGLSVGRIKREVESQLIQQPECPICLGPMGEGEREKLELCGHRFHPVCLALLEEAGGATCAVCRGEMVRGSGWREVGRTRGETLN